MPPSPYNVTATTNQSALASALSVIPGAADELAKLRQSYRQFMETEPKLRRQQHQFAIVASNAKLAGNTDLYNKARAEVLSVGRLIERHVSVKSDITKIVSALKAMHLDLGLGNPLLIVGGTAFIVATVAAMYSIMRQADSKDTVLQSYLAALDSLPPAERAKALKELADEQNKETNPLDKLFAGAGGIVAIAAIAFFVLPMLGRSSGAARWG